MKDEHEKKPYIAPTIKVIALKETTPLLGSSCVYPECIPVERI